MREGVEELVRRKQGQEVFGGQNWQDMSRIRTVRQREERRAAPRVEVWATVWVVVPFARQEDQ